MQSRDEQSKVIKTSQDIILKSQSYSSAKPVTSDADSTLLKKQRNLQSVDRYTTKRARQRLIQARTKQK